MTAYYYFPLFSEELRSWGRKEKRIRDSKESRKQRTHHKVIVYCNIDYILYMLYWYVSM